MRYVPYRTSMTKAFNCGLGILLPFHRTFAKIAIECLHTVPPEKKGQFQNTWPIHLQVSEAFEEGGILQWRPLLFNGTALYVKLNEMAGYSTAHFVIHFH